MTKIITLCLFLLLISCRENESNSRNNEEPKALQEKSINIGRFRSGDDLVEDLYQELVVKSPELKALENELTELNPRDTTDIFYNYDEKSNDYYRSADSYANVIKDSVMKKKILNLIKESEEKYVSQKSDLENLVSSINKKRMQINNYHNAMKIILTIPLIEQYQKQHLPNKSPFMKVIEKENKLLQKTKMNTPKY